MRCAMVGLRQLVASLAAGCRRLAPMVTLASQHTKPLRTGCPGRRRRCGGSPSPWRSSTGKGRHINFNDGNGNVEFCDLGAHAYGWAGAGWYRYTAGAGTQMPEAAPPIYSCGTDAPGWLNGAHPAIQDGSVTLNVCYHWSGNTCNWNNDIRVVNRGGFYLYELPAVFGCALAYCGSN